MHKNKQSCTFHPSKCGFLCLQQFLSFSVKRLRGLAHVFTFLCLLELHQSPFSLILCIPQVLRVHNNTHPAVTDHLGHLSQNKSSKPVNFTPNRTGCSDFHYCLLKTFGHVRLQNLTLCRKLQLS